MKKYDSYKDSGIEWIGEIPSHWEVKKLKYLSYIKTGYTPSKDEKENYSQNGTIWAKPDDLNEYIPIIDSREKISELGLKAQYIIPKDSILVCCIGSIGKFGIAGCDLVTNQQINAVVLNNTNIKPQFGKYLIGASLNEHERSSNGNVVRILNTENQKNISFPIPINKEQTAIANFLDLKTSEIDEIIADKKRLLELYEEEKTAIINKAVTKGINPDAPKKDSGVEWLGEIPEHWEMKKLKRLAKIFNGQDHKDVWDDNGNYPVIGSGGVFGNANKYLFEGPSVLLGRKGTIDKPQFITQPFWSIDTAYYTKIRNNVNPKLFFYLCTTIDFDQYKYGSAVPSMTRETLNQIYFFITNDTDEQDAIVHHIESECSKIDFKKARTEELIELLTEYRTALISEVVTGKIKVTED